MRVFLAADLDDVFLDAAASLGDRLRGASRLRATWVARPAMHVTLRFFGEASEPQIEALREAVASLSEAPGKGGEGEDGEDGGRGSPVVRAARVTGFPSAARARVLVLELDEGGMLADVAARAETAAVALGFAPETRAFRPHLTLARIKVPGDVRAHAGDAASLPTGRVTAITLYASTTGAAGPVYTALARLAVLLSAG